MATPPPVALALIGRLRAAVRAFRRPFAPLARPTLTVSTPSPTEERLPALAPVGPPATVNKTPQGQVTSAPALAAGRQTQPTNFSAVGLTGYGVIPRRQYQDLDPATFDIQAFDSGQLLVILADLNPDIGRARWNVLRIAGNALTFHVTTVAGKDDVVGQGLVNDLVGRINQTAGGFGAVVTQLLMTAYLQGAVCLDVAPTPALNDIEDLYPVNPSTIWFQRDANQVAVPFQRQSLMWGSGVAPYRRLNTELFTYTPIDPYVDDVYGSAPAAPVLQVVFFQVQVLRDLQRVIHAQGWPKIDLSVLTEIMDRYMPEDVRQDDQLRNNWLRDRMGEVMAAYNGMAPEDAYVHPDYVKVNSDAARAGSNLFDVQSLMQVIRSQIISGLKQLPVLMGEHLGDTETYSTIELRIFAASIDAFRAPVGHLLAWALGVALRLQGYQAAIEPVWEPLAIHDRGKVAIADAQEQANAAYARDQGWISQTQASIAITGSKEVAPAPVTPVPDNKPAAPAGPPQTP